MWSLNNTVLPELKELSNMGRWAVCANRPVTLPESLWKKEKPTHRQLALSPQGGRGPPQRGWRAPRTPCLAPAALGTPANVGRARLQMPAARQPRPWRQGPVTCGASTSEWSWEGCPMGSGRRAGGEGGAGPPQAPAWGPFPGSPSVKASVHTGPPRTRGLLTGAGGGGGGLVCPVAHPARPGPDWGWWAPPQVMALQPSGLPWGSAPSETKPLRELLCIWKNISPWPPRS